MKRLVLKGATFVLLVAALHVPVELFRGPAPFTPRDRLDAGLGQGADLVYFGDSVLDCVSQADGDPRPLPRMVGDLLPERRLALAQGAAFTPELFEAFVHYLKRQSRRPEVLLIPVNPGALSPYWEPRPMYQFRSEKFRLRYGDLTALLLLRPLNALKAYPLMPIPLQEFHAAPVFRGGKQVGVTRDFLSNVTAPPGMSVIEGKFVLRYMTPVTRDSRGVSALRRIAQLCREFGMTPRFYVTPVDVETGEREAGPELRERLAANVQVVREALAAEHVTLLDLSTTIDAAAFDWPREFGPNEHLKERGRAALAKRLASFVQSGK